MEPLYIADAAIQRSSAARPDTELPFESTIILASQEELGSERSCKKIRPKIFGVDVSSSAPKNFLLPRKVPKWHRGLVFAIQLPTFESEQRASTKVL